MFMPSFDRLLIFHFIFCILVSQLYFILLFLLYELGLFH